jgi:hypothetical protein
MKSSHQPQEGIMAAKAKEIIVSFDEVIGGGAKVFRLLADAKINIVAVCGYAMEGCATIDFLTGRGQEAKAKAVLKKAGYDVETADVITVTLNDKPGALAAVAEKLAAAKVNIEYAYATVKGAKALAVFNVSSPAKALKALK